MNKQRLPHHVWTRIWGLSTWYFVVLTVVSGVVCVSALRSNNQHMIKLRSAVYSADKNDSNVTTALNNLRAYVNGHMNTELATPDGVYPPIQLKYTYDRLVQAESQQVQATNTVLYTQAQTYCQQQDPVDFSGHNRVPCIENYVNTHGAQSQAIPDSLYQFNFASPVWSPDLAGWSLVAAILSAITAVSLFVTHRWLRR